MFYDNKSLAYLFAECMIYNERVFSSKDFYSLLSSHRISLDELNFDAIVKNTLFLFNQKGFTKIYFSTKHNEKIIWHPNGSKNIFDYSIEDIIKDLKLDLDNEFNENDLLTNYVNHLNKINDYIYFNDQEKIRV
jgi:hypothetical protein